MVFGQDLCHNAPMGQGKKAIYALLAAIFFVIQGCGTLQDVMGISQFTGGGDDDAPASSTPVIEATATYMVPLGGVAAGRDELVIYDASGAIKDFTGRSLTIQADNQNIELAVRPGFANLTEGSGALIVPKKVGTTIITYAIDGVTQSDRYKVVIPPQSLVQILLGEARGQMYSEAEVIDGHVTLTSESATGDAVGSVVRNRVLLTEGNEPLTTFIVDEAEWNAGLASSHWDAVINARTNDAYQFSPVDPNNSSYAFFKASELRSNLTDAASLIAYDQAVLTAGHLFSNDTADPTIGAFAFRTPTLEQSLCLTGAMAIHSIIMPSECGWTDDDFPSFAPIQVLILPSVTLLEDERPSFIFVRSRDLLEPAVTNTP